MQRLLIIWMIFFTSCHFNDREVISFKPKNTSSEQGILIIQPMGKLDKNTLARTFDYLKKIIPRVKLNEAVDLPAYAYYAPRNRYRADSIIDWYKRQAKPGEIMIAITEKDISSTQHGVVDFGIMGLGFQPGQACVVSSFRCGRESLYKVAIHELGHNMGLPHCPVKSCFMRDAAGKNPLREETGFCEDCKRYLKGKGWRL